MGVQWPVCTHVAMTKFIVRVFTCANRPMTVHREQGSVQVRAVGVWGLLVCTSEVHHVELCVYVCVKVCVTSVSTYRGRE